MQVRSNFLIPDVRARVYDYCELPELKAWCFVAKEENEEIERLFFQATREANQLKSFDALLDYTIEHGLKIKWLNIDDTWQWRVKIPDRCQTIFPTEAYGNIPLEQYHTIFKNAILQNIASVIKSCPNLSGLFIKAPDWINLDNPLLLTEINDENLPYLEELSLINFSHTNLNNMGNTIVSFNLSKLSRLRSLSVEFFNLNVLDLQEIGRLSTCENIRLKFECVDQVDEPIFTALTSLKNVSQMLFYLENSDLTYPEILVSSLRDLPCSKVIEIDFQFDLTAAQILLLGSYDFVKLLVTRANIENLEKRIRELLPELKFEISSALKITQLL